MRISETGRIIAGSFALYWVNKIIEVVHIHPDVLGLPAHATAYTIIATSALFSVAAGVAWILASYCLKALRHWHMRQSCKVPGAPANNP